ncbi:RES domain protein [compost metagenome]
MKRIEQTLPGWPKAYRIISSSFPPISVFEDVLDPTDLELAFAIEALTNDRLLDEAGVLARVAPEDRVSGPGSTPVMAAFTHVGAQSRFTDGSYGVYYCANSLSTAVAETVYHRERFMAATREDSLELTMRTYINQVLQPMHDIREGFDELHSPDPTSYAVTQPFAGEIRNAGGWGLLYNSVRAPGSECVAAFRPRALSIPVQGPHLRYFWDGRAQRITEVMQISHLDA